MREFLQCAEEEGPRADRGVEHGHPAEIRPRLGWVAVVDPTLRGHGGEAEAVDEDGGEAGTHDLAHQGCGRIVAAARAPLGGVHHTLEHAAQHVGRDAVTLVVLLARREVEPLEQLVERVAPVGVGPAGGAVAALEGGGLE